VLAKLGKIRRALCFLILVAFGFLFSFNSFKLAPQSPPNSSALVGINLSTVADWSTSTPFLDAFKTARPWLTQCLPNEPDCLHPWNTEEENKLDLDEQGWVKSLPLPAEREKYTRVATLLFQGVQHYPQGKYLVLYDGEGKLEYQWDAVQDLAASRSGRDVLDVTPSSNGIYLIITATDPQRNGNYLRNIRVIPAIYEDIYKAEVFNPEFLKKIRPFSALRFMDWLKTNNSVQKTWQDRAQVNQAFYTGAAGVPIEIMVELANRLNAHPWFNIPHQADDEYIEKFAQLVKDNIKPNLKVYVEYSNEVWNPQFQQFHWVRDNGWLKNQKTPYQSYGIRTAQMCQIWKQVFSSNPSQIKCVMATQTANPWVAEQVLTCPAWTKSPCYQHDIDLLAITGYFSGELGKPENQKIVKSWLSNLDKNPFDLAFKQLKNGGILKLKTASRILLTSFRIIKL
jgi:hypothetical protein